MMNSTQRSPLRRSISQPAPASKKILAESDIQNRIAALKTRERKQAVAAFRQSPELQGLKAAIIDQWVRDASAGVATGGLTSRFADCQLSSEQKSRVVSFALQHLAPSPTDDETTGIVKQYVIANRLIEQCLGLKQLTMRAQGQGMLELAFTSIIAEVPFIQDAPEFGWLKAAVDNGAPNIARVERTEKAGMRLGIARAMQTLLGAQPHRIAARDPIRGKEPPSFYLGEDEVQRFIAGVDRLIAGQDIEEIELDMVERFTPRLQRHMPETMQAEFADFVDLLNLRKEQERG